MFMHIYVYVYALLPSGLATVDEGGLVGIEDRAAKEPRVSYIYIYIHIHIYIYIERERELDRYR